MQHKLKTDADYYDSVDPSVAIAYAASRLEGIALKSIYPRLPEYGESQGFQTVRQLLDALLLQFSIYNRDLITR